MPIVQAVGVAVGNHLTSDPTISNMLEEVLTNAVKRCQARGCSDDEIREILRQARQEFTGQLESQ